MSDVVRTAVIEAGHHCFMLFGASSPTSTPDVRPNTLVRWLDHTSGVEADLIITTGSQYGPFAVELRVLDQEPVAPGPEWEDVVEVSVAHGTEIGVGEVVDGPDDWDVVTPVPRRLRVSARGRTESARRDHAVRDDEDDLDDDEAEEPLEHYLLELWPAPPAPAQVVREDSTYAREQLHPPEPVHPPEREAGLAAAWAVVRDLQGATAVATIAGSLTTVTVATELPGTPTHVYNRVQHVFGWPPCRGGMGGPDPAETAYRDATLPEYDRGERVGHIATTRVEVAKPKRLVNRWNWVLPGNGPVVHRPLLLAEDSTVTITVAAVNGIDQEPRCLVRVVHEGAPAAWADHLEALWRWHVVVQGTRP